MNAATDMTLAGVPRLVLEPGRLPPIAVEIQIAAVVFCFVVLAVVAVVAVVRSVRGLAAPEVEDRLRRMETTGGSQDPFRSILRTGDVADLRGLGLGGNWLRDLSLAQRIERLLRQAGLEMGIGEFGLFMLLAAFLGGATAWAAGWHDARIIAPAVIAACLPFAWLVRRRWRRYEQFGAQLPDALELMAGSLRAGHAYSAAINLVGDELSDPLAGEFRTMSEEYRVGINHRECLDRLLARMDHPDLRLFAISVLIQSETGGNLAEVLDSLSKTIRSRFNLLGRVRAITAEGRLSGIILAALPLVVAGVLSLLNPGYLSPLFHTTLGRVAIVTALSMQLIGFLWIRKIVGVRA